MINLKRQKGMSLVGLMVALGISSIMVMAMTQLIAITKNTYKTINNVNQMYLRAYETVTYMQRELEKAGAGLAGVSPTTLKPIEFISNTTTRGDVFKINIAQVLGYESTDIPGETCLGGKLMPNSAQPSNVQTGYSQFYVKAGTNNLTCTENLSATRYDPDVNTVISANTATAPTRTNETTTDFLFSNIEWMRILFGENDNGQRTVNRWIHAGSSQSFVPSVSLPHMVAARLHFAVRSQDKILTSISPNIPGIYVFYSLLTGFFGYFPPQDLYLRKVFTITVPFKHYNIEPYQPQCVPVPPSTGGGSYYLRVAGVRAQPVPGAMVAGVQPYTFTPGFISNAVDRCCMNAYTTNRATQVMGTDCVIFPSYAACDTARLQNTSSCSVYSNYYN